MSGITLADVRDGVAFYLLLMLVIFIWLIADMPEAMAAVP